jgi:hypothetical protein
VETILYKLSEGLKRYKMPHAITANIANVASVIRFSGVDEGDCLFLLIVFDNNRIESHRVVGTTVMRRTFDYKDISEDFFVILRHDYEMIQKCIATRNIMHAKEARTSPKQTMAFIYGVTER